MGDDAKAAVADRAQDGPDLRGFADSLPMALLRGREAVMRHFRPIFRDEDVTEQQWRVLRALADAGAIEVLKLARATHLRPPSLSRIVRDLDQRGLIRRVKAASDHRRVVVTIEPAGLELLKRIGPLAEAAYGEIELQFGKERLGQLFRLNLELEAALAPGGDAAGDGVD